MSDDQAVPSGEGVDLSAHSSFAPTKEAAPAQAPKAPAGEGVDLSLHSAFSPAKVTEQKSVTPEEPGFLEKTNAVVDTAVNKALAPNLKNIAPPSADRGITGDLKDQLGMAEESAKTLGRLGKGTVEATSGFLKSLPGAVYHAYSDPATAEEKARDAAQGSESESVLGRAGLGTERLVRSMTDPAAQAIKDYASGKVSGKDILENAEPALEQGAGTVIGGELLPKMGEAVKEGATTPGVKQMVTAPVRLASRAAEHVAPAAPVVGEAVAGFPGLLAARTLKGVIADTLKSGKTLGLPEPLANEVVLGDYEKAASKLLDRAQKEGNRYAASHMPEEVAKNLADAKEAMQDAKMHADAAREAADAYRAARKAPPEVPAAQIEAAPNKPILSRTGQVKPVLAQPGHEWVEGKEGSWQEFPIEPKPAVRPMNVKGPGEVQPETFPQTPTERPVVGRGQMNLPNEQGRMGGTKMLPEAPMNLPQEVLLPERAMVKSTEPPAAVREPVTIEATPKTNKAAVTPVAPPAATEMPASSIETKPAPVAEKVAPVKPADLERQINEGLGNEPVKPGVPMKEQKFSSRPDKAMLQKSGAAPEDIEKILPLTRVELSKLAGHFDVDLGDKAIGREKVASGTKITREDVLQKIIDAGHSPADIAKAIDEGKHLPTVSGGSQGATTEEPKATGYSLKADQRYPATTVGTEAGAKADTEHFANAKKELGEGASISDVAKRAQEMKDSAARVKSEFKPVNHEEYAKAVKENPQAATLTDPAETKNNKTFSNGKGVYYSISPEGDLQGVINNSGEKGALKSVMPHAIANGAKTLDAWDIYLPKQYEKYGFERAESVPYDTKTYGEPSQELKDAWKQQGWKEGDPLPAVQHMKLKETAEPKSYTGEERRATKRTAPMGAAELEDAMKNRKPIATPFDQTEGARETINKDLESKGLGTPKTPEATTETARMSDEDLLKKGFSKADIAEGRHLPTVSGGSGKLPTGDELIKKYGESSGDPKDLTFILKDGRGVKNTGSIHDEMLGGKATEKNPPRERFVAEGNIRVRPHQGTAGREVTFSVPETGVSSDQLKYIQKMSPQLKSGGALFEVGKPGGAYKVVQYGEATPEAIEKAVREIVPVLNSKGSPIDEFGNPTVSGGSQAATSVAKEKALPKLAEEHATEEEKAGVNKSEISRQNFVDNLKALPSVREFQDIAKAGEGGRKWYQRSAAAFDALAEEAPRYFKEGDRQKFTDFLAATSPQQSVKMNLGETLNAWTKYVDEGRPEGKPLEKLLKDNLTMSGAKVPNAMKALAGEPLWPDLTKNKNFKVPSFAKNLNGYLNYTTNDGWMALFGGLDAKAIASASSYHPLAVVTRAAADALGWEPAEAQAAIWAFTKVFTEKGEVDPKVIRRYSEDFADIMAQDPEIRQQLAQLGVNHAKLDAKLKAIGAKPPVTPGASPTTESSVRKLSSRIETARGKGTIPPPKSGYLDLFNESDEDTGFNPEQFRTQTDEPLTKLGKKKSPMKKM